MYNSLDSTHNSWGVRVSVHEQWEPCLGTFVVVASCSTNRVIKDGRSWSALARFQVGKAIVVAVETDAAAAVERRRQWRAIKVG